MYSLCNHICYYVYYDALVAIIFTIMHTIYFLYHHICVCVLLLFSHSVVSDSLRLWIIAHQAPLSMGFPRQEEY